MFSGIRDGVFRITACRLTLTDRVWEFARIHSDAIDAHWREAIRRNPGYFNGSILLLSRCRLDGAHLIGEMLRTDFKSVLYWRDQGYPEAGVRDGFGSALVRANDGGLLVAQQAAGHLNEGLYYLPGGFIDERDIDPDGEVDIVASVARELAEETGLTVPEIRLGDGLVVTVMGPHVSVGVPFVADYDSATLLAIVDRFIADEHGSELAACSILRSSQDLAPLKLAPYAARLLPALLEDRFEPVAE